MTSKARPIPTQFRVHESVDLTEAAVFEEIDGHMMASVRILKAGTSKNRRNYPPTLVKEAVDKKIFDNIQMFINHDRKSPEPQGRGLQEMVSAIESTSWNDTDKAMDARVEFFDRNFFDYAQRAKNYMGVSINALVKGNRRVVQGQTFEDVTQWVQPRSVDWVTTPAAGGAILAFEDEEENNVIDWTKITAAELKANAAEVYEAIQAEVKTQEPDPEPPAGDKLTAAQVATIVQEAIEKERKENSAKTERQTTARLAIQDAFEKSGLPIPTRTRVMASFEGVEQFDEKVISAAIESAKEELKAVGAGPVITGMGPSGGGDDKAEAKSFSVHESVKAQFGFKPAKSTNSDDSKEGAK